MGTVVSRCSPKVLFGKAEGRSCLLYGHAAERTILPREIAPPAQERRIELRAQRELDN